MHCVKGNEVPKCICRRSNNIIVLVTKVTARKQHVFVVVVVVVLTCKFKKENSDWNMQIQQVYEKTPKELRLVSLIA